MNEQKFTGKAELYEKFRPSYPNELIDFLYERTQCGSVADIGAGTGKFTRCLLNKPWKITAVEPNADMREKLSEIGEITVVGASAENTGLPEKSFGLVTAAQSFHWFDEERFKRECVRILEDGGKLAVIWNSFVREGLAARQTELCRKYSSDERFAKTGHTGVRSANAGDKFLGGYFGKLEMREYQGERVFDRESFIGESLSRSYSPREGESGFERFLEELNALYSEYESRGETIVRTRTVCYLGSF